jgi:hypothetical protein
MAAMAAISHLRGDNVGCVRYQCIHELGAPTHLPQRLYVSLDLGDRF